MEGSSSSRCYGLPQLADGCDRLAECPRGVCQRRQPQPGQDYSDASLVLELESVAWQSGHLDQALCFRWAMGFPCGVCKFLLAPIVATLTVAIPIHQGAGQQGPDYFRSAPESVDAARRCGTLWAMVMASTRRANVGSGHRPGRGASRHLRSGPSALDTFAPDACSGCLGCSGREDSLPKLPGHASMV